MYLILHRRLLLLLLQLLLTLVVVVGPCQLHHLRDAHEEIHGEQAVVLGYDHQRVTRPDDARGSQGGASRHGDAVGRSGQVTQAGGNETLAKEIKDSIAYLIFVLTKGRDMLRHLQFLCFSAAMGDLNWLFFVLFICGLIYVCT